MKVKIKGLVFVGFAAAILSANAMATDANTVTSKSYVDNKFQTISNKVAQGSAEDPVLLDDQRQDIDDTHYPTAAAVKAALDEVSSGASDAYQLKSNADFQIGMDEGEWYTLSNGTYTTVSKDDSTDTVKVDVAVMGAASAGAGGTVGLVPASSAGDQDKVLRADGTWVTNDTTTIATGGSNDAEGTIAVTRNGTTTAVAVKNVEVTGHKLAQGSATGSVLTVGGTNVDDTYYPTASAVANAINSAMGGQTIPQKSSLCSTYPCALVAQSNGLHWYTMATSTHDGGAVGDYCTTNTDCAGGLTGFTTCDTTTHACGAQ